MKYKTCTKCKAELPASVEYFCRSARYADGLSYFCIKCNSARVRKWEAANPQRALVLKKRLNYNRKLEILKQYSASDPPVCACHGCGVSSIQFLTLDHTDGDGASHRKLTQSFGGSKFYQWVKDNDFPSGLQVLCMNCNMAKGNRKECPVHTACTDLFLTFDSNAEFGSRIGIA